jgi:hypothetical protein
MIERGKETCGMPDWNGHERDTSALLFDALTTATTGSTRISRADRVLFTACEFWAAARNGSLMDHLRRDSSAQLRAAEAAFTVMGITKAATVLRLGRMALTESVPPVSLGRVVEFIETSLAELNEPVDRLIGAYAGQRVMARQNKHR